MIAMPRYRPATRLDLARERKPDLALVDVNLQDGATGPEIAAYLCKALRVPVLFISGDSDQLPDHLHGAWGALTKPVTQPKFVEVIRYIAARIQRSELNDPHPPSLRLPKDEALAKAPLAGLDS